MELSLLMERVLNYINRYAGVNPANGDALWYDKNGNLTTELKDSDKVLVGKSFHAPWQGGFGTAFSWKGISLSAQFSWVADRYMLNNDLISMSLTDVSLHTTSQTDFSRDGSSRVISPTSLDTEYLLSLTAVCLRTLRSCV